jgi:hypothetical protein
MDWLEFVGQKPPLRGAAVGTWTETASDTLAEVFIVRDEDFSETLAWLNSYFSGLSPITQWCRVLPHSVATRIAGRSEALGIGLHLGSWVGAILAECSAQAGGVQNLREIPGAAALSTATFAAGRATAIWSDRTDYREIAKRHDQLSSAISRESLRPVAAGKLLPLWQVVAGDLNGLAAADKVPLVELHSLLAHIKAISSEVEPAELVYRLALQARDYFDLAELTECAEGPQVKRVKALDRLGERLSRGPSTPVIDALLGMGASFIDPGSSVAPELLRRHAKQFPLSPIWQGVFAGALVPFRVLTDQGGLGRLISKSLLANDDLDGRPMCDIGFDELVRWVTPGRSLKLDVRGLSASALNVELMPGVTCSFPTPRPTVSASTSTSTSTSTSKVESRYESDRARNSAGAEFESALRSLQQRVSRLEEQNLSNQQSFDLPEVKENRSRKGSRLYTPKK